MTSPLSELPDVPLIPPEVYASRDRGDLVLFCGAGVSKNAGRPLFGELARRVKDEYGPGGASEDRAIKDEQFDVYLHLVEQRLKGAAAGSSLREFVRDALSEERKQTSVHESILRLSQSRDGRARLVTTNYDLEFEYAASKLGLEVRSEHAPRLAPPSRDRWNSIVHLHGGLDGDDPRDLVLTSGDFGRAYITERWAARFVSQLFNAFDVLFLGYSAEDVVMRYLLDAYAARSDKGRKVWAINAPPPRKRRAPWREQWEARGVELIPYSSRRKHRGFVKSLEEWAQIVSSPETRRERVARILAMGQLNLTVGNQRNQLEWLLGDSDGNSARALLAERRDGSRHGNAGEARNLDEPTGSAEWLDTFREMGFLAQHATRHHLREGITPSVTSSLVGPSLAKLALGDRALAFARWLASLTVSVDRVPDGRPNSRALFEWIQQPGLDAELHPELVELIRARIAENAARSASELTALWSSVLDLRVNGGQLERLPVNKPKLDISDATVDQLAVLMVNKTDFASREGRTGGGLEVLVHRGQSRRLLEAVELALTKYSHQPALESGGGRVLDPFPDRAARYLLAIAEHDKKSESSDLISPDELLTLWDRVEPVAMSADRGGVPDSSRDELMKALNHPVGKLAQALFAILLPKSVQYRSSLDARLKERVERNVTKPGSVGRAFLAIAASRLFVLHYAEPKWAGEVLIPHFDWKDEALARTSWQGYLWAPQLNQHLYAELRDAFLATFKRAEQLGALSESLCGLLVSLALDGGDTLTEPDTQKAIRGMSNNMRSTVLWQLGKRLDAAGGDSDEGAAYPESRQPDESAGARAAELARTRVLPWLRDWPNVWSGDKLADRLTLLALRCGTAFPEATAFVVEQQRVKLGRYQLSLSRVLRWPNDRVLAFAPHVAQLFDHVLPGKEEHLRQDASVWRPGALQQLVDKLREAGETVTSSPEFKRLEARL